MGLKNVGEQCHELSHLKRKLVQPKSMAAEPVANSKQQIQI